MTLTHLQRKLGTRAVEVTVRPPRYRVDVHTRAEVAAKTLELDEIGVATHALDRPVLFEPYARNRDLGGGILIDRMTNKTIGAVLLYSALRRSTNVHWQAVEVDKAARATLAGHRPAVVWFTGIRTYLIDGDKVRHGLSKDLGFTAADRIENLRRVGEVAAARRRKGLYHEAAEGDLPNLSGVDSAYEAPAEPEVHIRTVEVEVDADQAAEQIVEHLYRSGLRA